jgi:hypothetical protein
VRLKLISCEIFYREVCAVAARAANQVDVEFLTKGLHDLGAEPMRRSLQEALDRVDGGAYERVLLGYGLCGNGLAGLVAPTIPLVAPRSHDCIGLFLGGRERYCEYFQNHPGVYFQTSGWIERGRQLHQLSIQNRTGLRLSWEELVVRYGEENAQYLYEQLGDGRKNYRSMTFIEMGVEPDDRFERQAREEAEKRQWTYQKVAGDLSYLERLVNGPWEDREFLTVPPGWQIAASYGEDIIRAVPPASA